ncbi:MAG: hypothetical protein S4CHLAM6_07690 [Chlamydiae bacterium]|nr:hypothetical protein [Chlamydiota bacterium]
MGGGSVSGGSVSGDSSNGEFSYVKVTEGDCTDTGSGGASGVGVQTAFVNGALQRIEDGLAAITEALGKRKNPSDSSGGSRATPNKVVVWYKTPAFLVGSVSFLAALASNSFRDLWQQGLEYLGMDLSSKDIEPSDKKVAVAIETIDDDSEALIIAREKNNIRNREQ